MKEQIKRVLTSFTLGRKLLNYIQIKRWAFQPASGGSFRYLDRFWRKRTVDRVYENAFDQIFTLLKSLPLGGDVLEFGVFQGYTALLFAKGIKKFSMENTSLHLFDSFVGLPKEEGLDEKSYEFSLGVWKEGSMKVNQRIEKNIQKKLGALISEKRVHVIKGFFEVTLSSYFEKKAVKAKLVHIDCDLYSSSKYVLEFLLKHEIVQDGTILIFDDWMTSLGNPNLGQRRATQEVLDQYPMWSIEKYCNYGVGSHVFILHDMRVGL